MQRENCLKPFFQKRFVCERHGYFDMKLSRKPGKSFKAVCPECGRPAVEREGYECTGKTTGPVPHTTRPRIDETIAFEFPDFGTKGFRQSRRRRAK